MSIMKQSAAVSVPSPVKKYISFSGKSGAFTYWDKETGKEIEINLPVKFTVLDELSTIVGWDDASGSKIYSNEVHSVQKQQLIVRSKGGVKAEGLYADIKRRFMVIGAKYSKSVYILMDNEICNINMKGAVLKAWIDKEGESNTWAVLESETRKKGSVTYKVPVFTKETDSIDNIEKARELYTSTLLPYLRRDVIETSQEKSATVDDFADDLPF